MIYVTEWRLLEKTRSEDLQIRCGENITPILGIGYSAAPLPILNWFISNSLRPFYFTSGYKIGDTITPGNPSKSVWSERRNCEKYGPEAEMDEMAKARTRTMGATRRHGKHEIQTMSVQEISLKTLLGW